MKGISSLCGEYARMWPREIFDYFAGLSGKQPSQPEELKILDKPGVYVLYRDEIPCYIGQAIKLRYRLFDHANRPDDRYYNFWNFFSAFVVEDKSHRNEIEGILIAAMPTANSAQPRVSKRPVPECVKNMLRGVRQGKAKHYMNNEIIAKS